MKRNKTIHNTEYSNLIDALCLERKRLALSQTEVALSIGMSQSEISKIETLERRIDIFEFRRLISVYRVNENKKLQQLIENFFELD